MDGSASPFVFLIQSAGIEVQNVPKRFIRIKKPVEVKNGDKWVRLDPFDGFRVGFTIDFDHPFFRNRNGQLTLDFAEASFVKEISRARTFGFIADYERLREQNLVRGGSLENALSSTITVFSTKTACATKTNLCVIKFWMLLAMFIFWLQSDWGLRGLQVGSCTQQSALRKLLADESAWEYTESPSAVESSNPCSRVCWVPRTRRGSGRSRLVFLRNFQATLAIEGCFLTF